MILIRNAAVYAPDYLGTQDLLVAGERIVALAPHIDAEALRPFGLQEYDLQHRRLIPGLIDAHVHIAGAGGEGGPATRTPEIQLSQLLVAGVTGVVGCLGTDGITRSPVSVLMKAKALRAEGVSAWMYTGSYQVPTPTITGEVSRDLALIDEVIGIGEIALSDHRSSCPTTDELIRLVAHARVGAMLGGKGGVANIHMGDARDPFGPIHRAVEASELSYKQFLPTHCNRNDYIFEDAKQYGKLGYIDLTASSYPYFPQYEVKPSKAIVALLDAGVPIEHITMTSDAIGSLPDFDEQGRLIKLAMGQPKSIFDEMMETHLQEGLALEQALRIVTSNVADALRLPRKGRIAVDMDADLVVLDHDHSVHSVMARGQWLLHQGRLLRRGAFEQ